MDYKVNLSDDGDRVEVSINGRNARASVDLMPLEAWMMAQALEEYAEYLAE